MTLTMTRPAHTATPDVPAAIPPGPPLPDFAQIEPIGRCNLACRMCTVNDRGDVVTEMPLEQFTAILDQLPALKRLHLQGLGEPMLHPQFFDMVELAAQRGIEVSTNSNLTLLTEARAWRCVTSGLASLSVSLDGATAPVYEAVRRGASFDKVMRNLDRLVAARNATASPLHVRGVMVLMRANLPELPALIRLLHGHGVRELLVQRLSSDLTQPDLPARYIPIRQYCDTAELTPDDLPHANAVFDEARALAASLGFTLHLPRLTPPPAQPNGPKCNWPSEQLYLTAAGEMLPCCMVATADRATLGNVFGTPAGPGAPDVPGVWAGPVATAFRTALASDTPPAVCQSCALYRGTF
jgi:MoaA/NifB/PqqE/SkfB family radical SAM enzyme